ncbi:long-chain fatty acid--CoA ligase [Sporosarcina sp. P13]|uniref:long-chain-fatty-acid--CoA ligase n=1 Tax=Sporosarcina sp. P13 TaxID=2048263 RepID=UPI0018EA8042|nr:long-chain fatty acid--CoA ligase [Sporosarcina sp. P13]
MQSLWFKSYPENIPHEIVIEDKTMVDVFYEAVSYNPDHLALVEGDREMTYAELRNRVHQLSNALTKKGVKKGDRVALMMENSIECVISYYAVLVIGAVVVQNNPLYTRRELYYQLKDADVSMLIIDEHLAEQFLDVTKETPVITVWLTGNSNKSETSLSRVFKEESTNFEYVPLDAANDVAILQYTGGTTGLSKGVMLTHRNIFANVVQTHTFLGVYTKPSKERLLNVLPLFHVYGMTVSMNYMIYLKSTMHLVRKFKSTETLQLIDKYKITMFPGTPTIYVAVNNDENVSQYNIDSIHTCISGSAPLPVEIKNQFERLTGAKIVDAYGLSEASPVTHTNPINGVRKPGSMGLPIPNTEAKIMSVADGINELSVNEPGELVIKGPQVMKGYWGMTEETEAVLRDGWLYTGDIAYIDEDGYFYIVSRKKEVIISSGFNIYPRDVEEVVFNHPAVQEVVAIGVPHEYRGENVKVFIVLKSGYKLEGVDIIDFCKDKMAKYKLPSEVEFLDELPKTAVGKVLRRKLAKPEIK